MSSTGSNRDRARQPFDSYLLSVLTFQRCSRVILNHAQCRVCSRHFQTPKTGGTGLAPACSSPLSGLRHLTGFASVRLVSRPAFGRATKIGGSAKVLKGEDKERTMLWTPSFYHIWASQAASGVEVKLAGPEPQHYRLFQALSKSGLETTTRLVAGCRPDL